MIIFISLVIAWMTSMEALSVTLAVIVVWQYLYSKSLQAQVDRIEILQIDQLSKQISRIEQELERIKDAPHKDYDAPSALGSPELKSTDLVREDHDQIAPEEGSLEEMRQERYSEMSEISEISEISELLSDGAATFDDQNSTDLAVDEALLVDQPTVETMLTETESREERQEEPSEARTDLWTQVLWTDLLRGSLMTRVGALMLLIGLSYLIRYIAKLYQPSLMSIHVLASLGGLIFVIIGWRLSHKRQQWRAAALATQGAGLALNALSLVSAARVYALITLDIGFGGFCLTMALGVILALRQRSIGLAFTCILGAFITPVLLPVIQEADPLSYVYLLCYETVINLTILWLSVRASWRSLNLIGFTGTSISLLIWAGAQPVALTPSWYLQVALCVTVLIFISASLSHSTRQRSTLRGWLDGCIWWGTPSLVFGVERLRFPDDLTTQGIALVSLGLMYIGLYLWIRKTHKNTHQLTMGLLIRLAAVSVGLAAALILDAEVKILVWGIEGLGLAWLSNQQNERKSLGVGVSFVLIATIMWTYQFIPGGLTLSESLSGVALAMMLLTLAYLMSHSSMSDSRTSSDSTQLNIRATGQQVTLIGLIFSVLVLSLTFEALGGLPESGQILSLALSAPFFSLLGERLSWSTLTAYLPWLAPCTALVTLIGWYRIPGGEQSVFLGEPLQTWSGASVVVTALASLIYLAWRSTQEMGDHPRSGGDDSRRSMIRYSLLYTALGWITVEFYALGKYLFDIEVGYTLIALSLSIPLWALVISNKSSGSSKTPSPTPLITRLIFPRWHREPSRRALIPQLVLLAAIAQVILWYTPPTKSLMYLPLLNPSDLVQWFGIYILVGWYRGMSDQEIITRRLSAWFVICLCFIAINHTLLRGAVALGFTAFSVNGFWSHHGLQALVAIVWGGFALGLMRRGSSQRSTQLWWGGLGLLVITLIKVWFVDVQITNQLGRVVAFMGVGGVMLLIGYWAPAPQDEVDRSDVDRSDVDHSNVM